ncbi:MAG: hypothetical protein LIP03_12055 [Bacteroidales bacterium]|nr:hypothetical protein [Bacteroidales bacterium]
MVKINKGIKEIGLIKNNFVPLREICEAMTQKQAVITTIDRLGGLATLNAINQSIFKIEDCNWGTKTPFASIRRIVRHTPEIYRIKPGLYGLTELRAQHESHGIFSDEAKAPKEKKEEFNHTYYQGILLELGLMRHHDVYVPSQDKNRKFDSRTLGEMASLAELPEYTYHNLVHRSSTIDTIWMNERRMPHSFFEVEHSTDIYNSLLKFVDLQDFYVKMFIVADEKRHNEFEQKMGWAAFKDLKDEKRVTFLSYDKLKALYDLEVKKAELSLGI